VGIAVEVEATVGTRVTIADDREQFGCVFIGVVDEQDAFVEFAGR